MSEKTALERLVELQETCGAPHLDKVMKKEVPNHDDMINLLIHALADLDSRIHRLEFPLE